MTSLLQHNTVYYYYNIPNAYDLIWNIITKNYESWCQVLNIMFENTITQIFFENFDLTLYYKIGILFCVISIKMRYTPIMFEKYF